MLPIRTGVETDRDEMLRKLVDLQYARNDIDFKRATFRVRGDVVELHPSYEEFAYRIEFFGDEITSIDAINPLTGELLASHDQIFIYPAVHYVMPEERVEIAVQVDPRGAGPAGDEAPRRGQAARGPAAASPARSTTWR